MQEAMREKTFEELVTDFTEYIESGMIIENNRIVIADALERITNSFNLLKGGEYKMANGDSEKNGAFGIIENSTCELKENPKEYHEL